MLPTQKFPSTYLCHKIEKSSRNVGFINDKWLRNVRDFKVLDTAANVTVSGSAASTARSLDTTGLALDLKGLGLSPGTYRFEVVAYNAVGDASAPAEAVVSLVEPDL